MKCSQLLLYKNRTCKHVFITSATNTLKLFQPEQLDLLSLYLNLTEVQDTKFLAAPSSQDMSPLAGYFLEIAVARIHMWMISRLTMVVKNSKCFCLFACV